MKNRLQILFIPALFFLVSSFLTAQEFGIASIYQDKFHGKVTAYGRTYNKNELVAAHKKHLPGTFLKVTRLDNKQSVTVEVIDRGPFVKGRIVDLSSRAAQLLGMLEEGVANVKVEVVQQGKPVLESALPKEEPRTPPAVTAEQYDDASRKRIETGAAERTTAAVDATKEPTGTLKTTSATTEKTELTAKGSGEAQQEQATEVLVGKSFTFYGLYKLELKKAAEAAYGVQVAYLTNFEGLLKQVADLQAKYFDNILFYKEDGNNGALAYKVILGPFESEDKAKSYQNSLAKKGIKGFVVAAGENYEQTALYKIQLKKPVKVDYGVQVASLANEEGMMKQVADLQSKWYENTLVSIEKAEDGIPVYKVVLGPFETEDKAKAYHNSLAKKGIKGFVVALN